MPIAATSNLSFVQAPDTYQTQMREVRIHAVGLMANTTYQISIQDTDYGFATRQIGKRLGDSLVSNSSGQIDFFIYTEVPFNSQYGPVDGVSPAPARGGVLQTQNSPNNYRQTTNLLTLSAPGSTLQFEIPATYYFVPTKPNQINEGT
jgi:hypothetical protein